MRRFLIDISDWKSSKQIARMDAAEERGYLRLLMDAAESPDCGLPDSDDELRGISLLRKQWGRVTQDEDYQYEGQTSGAKLLACFFCIRDGEAFNAADGKPYIPIDTRRWRVDGLQPGRLYNESLLIQFRDSKRKWPKHRLPSSQWRRVRLEVFVRDNWTCRYCETRNEQMECDHVLPVAKGGTHTKDNLATACQNCNRSKSAKTLEEWLQ